MFTNIRTTLCGFVLIALGLAGLYKGLDSVTCGGMITAGVAAVLAKDSNVTGGTKEQ